MRRNPTLLQRNTRINDVSMMYQKMPDEIVVTPLNINDYFSEMELFLNSFFDSSYTKEKQWVMLENETYRIRYTKLGVKYSLNIEVLSPSIDSKTYFFSFLGFTPRNPLKPKSFSITNLETQSYNL